jgi:hypothetical protein
VTVSKSGASCSLGANRSGFNINCIPAGAIPPARYTCVATSDGKSTLVRCAPSGRTEGDD